MEQQEQAFNYFQSVAENWQEKSTSATYNAIKGRNNAVMKAIARHANVGDFLDMGCGTGQLAIEVGRQGIRSVGMDYAQEMIDLAEKNAAAEDSSTRFVCQSIFDFPSDGNGFDVISGQGLIEYISPQEFEDFLAKVAAMLKPGGIAAIGSRNRLFNVVSLNDYTRQEMDLGVVEGLIDESIFWQTSRSANIDHDALARYEALFPHPESHPGTGIDVKARFQYTPGNFSFIARKHGLQLARLHPVHFHGVPDEVRQANPSFHGDFAVLIEEKVEQEHRIVPFCSSFVAELEKV